jgi:phage terminase large subunit-like protein
MAAQFAGTRRLQQELEGEFVRDVDGALWTWEMLEAARAPRGLELDRIVVAVDPAVSGAPDADACGIVVAGVSMQGPPQDWVAEVIADASVKGFSPQAWADRVVALYHAHGADRVVAEVNQGGAMVADLVRNGGPMVPFRAVNATRGKVLRAEPVAALYEQGRVRHRGVFRELEAQMLRMTGRGFEGRGSPDRVDALVWAITELMIDAAADHREPSIRTL